MGFPPRQKVIIIKETITQHGVLSTPPSSVFNLAAAISARSYVSSSLIIMKTFLSVSALPTKVLCIYFAYMILFLGEAFWVFDLNVC